MPIEIDVISWLAAPHIAATVVLILVAALSVFFHFLSRFLSPQALQTYILTIQFIAEILVSVGLIGLVSFAGRTKIEIDAVELKAAVHQSEREVSLSFFPYATSECLSPTQPPDASPTAAAIAKVCGIWAKFNNVHDATLPWHEAGRELDLVAMQKGLYPPLRENIKTMSSAIDRMQEARHNAALVPLKRDLLTSKMSWVFLLLCTLSACVGVSLKCARAALQLRWRSAA